MRKSLLCIGVVVALASAVSALEGITVVPYGHAQYRLRLRMTYKEFAGGEDTLKSKYEYKNQIAYFLGTKATVGEQLHLQFQIGNDWVFTEEVDWLANNNFGAKSGVYPFFHLAYASWNPGPFHLAFGIQPLFNYGPLDLLERSVRDSDQDGFADGSYAAAALYTYPVGTNNSWMGVSVGAPILKDNFKLGVDYFMSIIEDRPDTFLEDPEINPNAILNVINIPMATGPFTITPQAFVLLYKYYSEITGEGDNEYGAGLAATYKIGEGSSVRASFGYARNATENSEVRGDSTQQGIIAGAEGKFAAGPGSIIAAVNWSSDENLDRDDSRTNFLYTDLKYGWKVIKGMVIMPRVRTFTVIAPDNAPFNYQVEVRPEILFIGAF